MPILHTNRLSFVYSDKKTWGTGVEGVKERVCFTVSIKMNDMDFQDSF